MVLPLMCPRLVTRWQEKYVVKFDISNPCSFYFLLNIDIPNVNTIQHNNKENNKEHREQPGERKSNYNLNKVIQKQNETKKEKDNIKSSKQMNK